MAHNFERFGKYVLLEKLAAGGMAEVYLSKNTGAIGVSKFVAIKRILPQYSDNEEFVEMFKEEAKIAVNLNHSNVVHIHEFGVEDNQFYLVMEYVEGRNLRQILNELKKKNNHFQIDQIVYIIKEVAAGLDHAHRCLDGTTGKPLNITHRDMSPQNIMVSFEGEIKIIDFGIAKAETQLESTKAGTLKGKFGYMSPEQADGQNIDLRTDVFSLGIVLWELLGKDRLFSGSSEAAILRKIRDCNIPSLRKMDPSIHPDLEKIVNKALAKDKNLRYQTSAALHRDLNKFLNTHYPEFSPQDFSVFIKHAFADAYSEQKGKLVEFSHIQVDSQGVETNTITRVNEKFKNQVSSQDLKDRQSSSNSPILVNSGVADNGVENLALDVNINENIDVKLEKRKGISDEFTGRVNKTSITSTYGGSKNTSRARYNFEKTKSKKKGSFLNPILFLIFLGLIGFGYLKVAKPNLHTSQTFCEKNPKDPSCLKSPTEQYTDGYQNIIEYCIKNQNDTSKCTTKDPRIADACKRRIALTACEQTDISSTTPLKTMKIRFESDPVGADVYIDDTKVGLTPLVQEIKFDPNKPNTKVTMKKTQFFESSKTMLLNTDNMVVKEKLFPEKWGYIVVNALGAGSQYEIKINGETKKEYELRKPIRVPAGVSLQLEMVNSLGFKASEHLVVEEDTRRTIDLILK